MEIVTHGTSNPGISWIRTCNLPVTNPMLYRLNHRGFQGQENIRISVSQRQLMSSLAFMSPENEQVYENRHFKIYYVILINERGIGKVV